KRVTRFGTPGQAIVVSTVLAGGLALVLGYTSLVDTANVTQFGQYIPVCLATLVLRYRQKDAPRSYTAPGGPVIPVLATFTCVWLLWKAQPKQEEWIFTGQILAVGIVVWAITVALRRARSGSVAEAR